MRDRTILEAAKRLFYERGFDAVGVDEIGEAAGVSGPAIYRHFRGKDEILATLFDEAMDRLLMLSGRPRENPFDDLRELARAHAEFALGDRELLSVYSREDRSLSDTHRRRLHRRERQFVERWKEALRRCDPARNEAELTSMTYAIIGLIISAAHWPREALATPRLTELVVEMALGAAGLTGDVAGSDLTGGSDQPDDVGRPVVTPSS